MIDRQAILNQAVEGIVKQGRSAYDPVRQQCVYRLDTPEGRCNCAVGVLFEAAGLYDPAMEGAAANYQSLLNSKKLSDLYPTENIVKSSKAVFAGLSALGLELDPDAHINPYDDPPGLKDLEFLGRLQQAHDGAAATSATTDQFFRSFKFGIKSLATYFKLTVPAILKTV